MATTLKANVRPTLQWEYRSEDEISTAKDDNSLALDILLLNGTGLNEANVMYRARRTVTFATPDDEIDLAGILEDRFGATLTFVKIKAIEIINRGEPNGDGTWTPNAGDDLLVGGAAANPFFDWIANATDIVKIGAGGVFILSAPVEGYTVAAGTEDKLLISHGGITGDIEYDIVLIGTDA